MAKEGGSSLSMRFKRMGWSTVKDAASANNNVIPDG